MSAHNRLPPGLLQAGAIVHGPDHDSEEEHMDLHFGTISDLTICNSFVLLLGA